MVDAFERASDRTVPYQIVARRPGDAASVYADPSLLDAMCRDAWRWQQDEPGGIRAVK
jgi:UDP-glucose 4-epimerase